MTGAEVRAIRTKMQLRHQDMGTLLGVAHTTVYRWEAEGARELPQTVGAAQRRLLEELAQCKSARLRAIGQAMRSYGWRAATVELLQGGIK